MTARERRAHAIKILALQSLVTSQEMTLLQVANDGDARDRARGIDGKVIDLLQYLTWSCTPEGRATIEASARRGNHGS